MLDLVIAPADMVPMINELITVKQFYRPLQPSVKADNGTIGYREIQPDKAIEHIVYCHWRLHTKKELNTPFTYRVVSDGCIDIFFNRNDTSESFVMGFSRKYVEFSIGTTFDYIGIRFLPAAFPLIYGINAKTLSDRSQELAQVLPRLSQWIRRNIRSTQSFETITDLLNMRLRSGITGQRFDLDMRFFKALHLIFRNKGLLDTQRDLETGLSPRQLRRVFNFYIGTTPKAFCNVVRFQHILNAKPSHQSQKEDKLYLDLGFFDQAHFIKHFKTFYGVTPSRAFR